MSISQLSQLSAIARVKFNDDAGFEPAFVVQRGFREVRPGNVNPPGPMGGFCQLIFDASFGLPSPDEFVVVISPESVVVPERGTSKNADVDWQWYFDPGFEEWTLLVVTSNCNGAAPRTFNVVAHRVN